MKNQLQALTIMTLMLASSMALAEAVVTKPTTRIDFNKLIEDSNVQRNDLRENMDRATAKHVAAPKDDKSKVIDFIDVEVGVGQVPSVVDRRFDSVD